MSSNSIPQAALSVLAAYGLNENASAPARIIHQPQGRTEADALRRVADGRSQKLRGGVPQGTSHKVFRERSTDARQGGAADGRTKVGELYGLKPLGGGLINQTFALEDAQGNRWILQRLNPIFDPAIHLSIEAVCAHLRQKGLLAPTLRKTKAGELYVQHESGVWRMMDALPGHCVERAQSAAQCQEAGRLLGAFHQALVDLDHGFPAQRAGVHDTDGHIRGLKEALAEHQDHPFHRQTLPLATEILERLEALPRPTGLPKRAVHGDPKIANMLFDDDGKALALIDLDTLGRMPLHFEMGDAMRSWCNPAGEDEAESAFNLDFFSAAMDGYKEGSGDFASPEEKEAIVHGVELIALELAARFCRDILRESYFGWDSKKYDRAAVHNLLRTQSQLSLARSYAGHKESARRIVMA